MARPILQSFLPLEAVIAWTQLYATCQSLQPFCRDFSETSKNILIADLPEFAGTLPAVT